MSVEALREWGTRSIAGCGWRWEPADSGEGGPRGQFGGRAGKVGWESPGKRSEGACHCAVVVLIEKKNMHAQPSSGPPMAQSLRRDKVVGQSQDDTRMEPGPADAGHQHHPGA